jgi:hypothetical protein
MEEGKMIIIQKKYILLAVIFVVVLPCFSQEWEVLQAWTDINGMKVLDSYWYRAFKPEYSGNGNLLAWAEWYTPRTSWGRIKVNRGEWVNIKISNDMQKRIDDDARSAFQYIKANYDMTGPASEILYWELYILQIKTDTGYVGIMLKVEYEYGKLAGFSDLAHVDFFYK